MRLAAAWLTIAISAAGLIGPATAQPVYRCGNAYSSMLCPQGQAIDSDDSRTPAQRNEALRIAAAEKRQGDEMESARLRREAALKPAPAVAISLAPAPAATAATARKPSSKKLRIKAKDKETRSVAATNPKSGGASR